MNDVKITKECRILVEYYGEEKERDGRRWEKKKGGKNGDLLKPEIYVCVGKSGNMKNGWVNLEICEV